MADRNDEQNAAGRPGDDRPAADNTPGTPPPAEPTAGSKQGAAAPASDVTVQLTGVAATGAVGSFVPTVGVGASIATTTGIAVGTSSAGAESVSVPTPSEPTAGTAPNPVPGGFGTGAFGAGGFSSAAFNTGRPPPAPPPLASAPLQDVTLEAAGTVTDPPRPPPPQPVSAAAPDEDPERRPATAAGASAPVPDQTGPEMVKWTKSLGIATIVLSIATIMLMFATGISTYFLYTTNESIEKQVELSRGQLRPYVGLARAHLTKTIESTDRPESITDLKLTLPFKNFGTTPAKEFRMWVGMDRRDDGNDPDFTKIPIELSSHESVNTLFPGQEITVDFVVGYDRMRKLKSGEGVYFVWGRVDYREFLGPGVARYTRFCAVLRLSALNPYKGHCNIAE